MTDTFSAPQLAHLWMERYVKPGDFCVDATAGRGRDTLHLCRLVGETGRVLALDIQPEAIESTRELLAREGVLDRARLVQAGHENLADYAAPESVSCIAYNFGWLPGGNHDIFTQAKTSIAALEASLTLLRPGGVITLCIYYGRNNGTAERDALLEWLARVDPARYTVLRCSFWNRGGDPPIPVLIARDE